MIISSRKVLHIPGVPDVLTVAERAVVEAEAIMIAGELRRCLGFGELQFIQWTLPWEMSEHRELRASIIAEYDLNDPNHHITTLCKRDPVSLELAADHPCNPENFSTYCLLKLRDDLITKSI